MQRWEQIEHVQNYDFLLVSHLNREEKTAPQWYYREKLKDRNAKKSSHRRFEGFVDNENCCGFFAASLSRTGLFTKDGHYRQFESFSCAQMDPPHIHFYRAMAMTLVMPEIERDGLCVSLFFFFDLFSSVCWRVLTAMIMFAKGQDKTGMISEDFGGGCFSCCGANIGTPNGGPRGDDNSVFLLDVYVQGCVTVLLCTSVQTILNATQIHELVVVP